VEALLGPVKAASGDVRRDEVEQFVGATVQESRVTVGN
jgi:hypothetical protein